MAVSNRSTLGCVIVLGSLMLHAAAGAQTKPKDSELDALDLKAEPTKAEVAGKDAAKPVRLSLEAAVGRYQLRYGLGDEDTYRASFDFRFSTRLSPAWRTVLSDRLDHLKPASGDRTINTLREAYLGWQNESANTSVEFGRINLRNGSGYGFNPSDFFRDGSLRTSTTLDPIALRDYRQGSFALRAQRLWAGGGVSAIVSPKLTNTRSNSGASLDLGSTNHSTRLQLGWSHDPVSGVSLQVLGFKQTGEQPRLGGNFTALLGGSVVLHGEAAYGRERDLADRVLAASGAQERGKARLATGLTTTLPGSLSLTGELQYNGFALSKSAWDRLGASGGPGALGTYLQEADRLQDLPVRRALLVYLSKKDLFVKGLDLTSFARINVADKSRLLWAELRHEFGAADVALQWQQLNGKPLSEFGVLPLKRSVQLTVTYRM